MWLIELVIAVAFWSLLFWLGRLYERHGSLGRAFGAAWGAVRGRAETAVNDASAAAAKAADDFKQANGK